MAEDLMANEAVEHCLVVGTEEVDWLLCDAYRRWRLLRSAPPIEPFSQHQRGMILGEGAGAILLSRQPRRSTAEAGDGLFTIEYAHPGGYFTKRAEAEEILKKIISDLSEGGIDLVISSANGTFIDQAEHRALEQVVPDALVYTGKPALGESVGAAGLWQVILAVQGLRSAELPPVLHIDRAVSLRLSFSRTTLANARRAIVLSSGLNQQAAGLRLAVR
jgi:3-oxoacyl-(acyl-carrier-protein) synthase